MKSKILYYVYELIDPRNNRVFYVGKGKEDRMYIHVKNIKNNIIYNENKKLINKIKKILRSGYEDAIYNKIFESEDENICYDKEINRISEIGVKNLCNLTIGGDGFRPTDETRNKLSKTMKLLFSNPENNPMYGKHHTSETKDIISKKLKDPNSNFQNIIKSQRYRENMSKSTSGNKNGMYGKNQSDIWIKKYGIEEANKRKDKMCEKISMAQLKRFENKEERDKVSVRMKGKFVGKNHPMYRKSAFDVWVEKYGIECAINKKEIRKQKQKQSALNRWKKQKETINNETV